MRSLVKLLAGVCVCKVPDAQAVGGVELSHEELAARLPHRHQLQDGGGRQQHLGQGGVTPQLYIHLLSPHSPDTMDWIFQTDGRNL